MHKNVPVMVAEPHLLSLLRLITYTVIAEPRQNLLHRPMYTYTLLLPRASTKAEQLLARKKRGEKRKKKGGGGEGNCKKSIFRKNVA